jgi:hypothetical protein
MVAAQEQVVSSIFFFEGRQGRMLDGPKFPKVDITYYLCAILSHLFLAPFSIFISVIPIGSALLRRLGFALPIDAFSLGSTVRI